MWGARIAQSFGVCAAAAAAATKFHLRRRPAFSSDGEDGLSPKLPGLAGVECSGNYVRQCALRINVTDGNAAMMYLAQIPSVTIAVHAVAGASCSPTA